NVDTANLVATLLATNGVTAPTGPVTYGVLRAGGATVSGTFGFTATGTNGGNVIATLHLQDGTRDLGLVTFNFTVGRGRYTFANWAGILIPGSDTIGPASPYPSSIVVSNVPGGVTNVTISLFNLTHTYPPDIDILLVGPQTNNLVLMSDSGLAAPDPRI